MQACTQTRCIFAAYDADLVLKVTSVVLGSRECGAGITKGAAVMFDPLTRRPMLAQLDLCREMPTNDLATALRHVVREMFHLLVCLILSFHCLLDVGPTSACKESAELTFYSTQLSILCTFA